MKDSQIKQYYKSISVIYIKYMIQEQIITKITELKLTKRKHCIRVQIASNCKE